MRRAQLALAALAAVLCLGAASDPAERLADPAKEARARALFRQVRCLMCQNQSIDDSEAPFAFTVRQVVREQVTQGKTDPQVKAFLRARFGEYILLQPPFNPANAVLWLAPFAVVIAGAGLLVLRLRNAPPVEPLSQEEQARLDQLVGEDTIAPH